MKSKLLLLAVSVAVFSSCSTMYKTGQTPDDVYYSPLRPAAVVQNTEKEDDKNDQVNYYNTEDRLIRMGIYDSRFRYMNMNNDFNYSPYYHTFYDSYSYGSNFYRPIYNKSYYNDYYYNPFYSPAPVYITSVKPIKNTTPRTTNLNGYGKNYNNSNTTPLNYVPGAKPATKSNGNPGILGKILNNVLSPAPSYNNRNSSSTGTNNNTNNNTNTPSRTYTPSSNSGSSSSSSGSSSSGGRITRSQ